jgi:hypothetical protein
MADDTYYSGYPTRPIGGGNPYWACIHCGRSDPEINGRLEGHGEGCSWAVAKAEEVRLATPPKIKIVTRVPPKVRGHQPRLPRSARST